MMVVAISWVAFWLSREATDGRIALGITTVLTTTTLISTTNNSMPKVSYVKALDVFLNFCFVMVFASLVESAVVAYWTKHRLRRREGGTEKGLECGEGGPHLSDLPRITPTGITKYPYPTPPPAKRHWFGGLVRWCSRRVESPAKIDRCSRLLFPLLFIFVSYAYWAVLSYLAVDASNQVEYVYFDREE